MVEHLFYLLYYFFSICVCHHVHARQSRCPLIPSRLAEPAPHGMLSHARRSCFSHARRPVRHLIKVSTPFGCPNVSMLNDPPSFPGRCEGYSSSDQELFSLVIVGMTFLGKVGLIHILGTTSVTFSLVQRRVSCRSLPSVLFRETSWSFNGYFSWRLAQSPPSQHEMYCLRRESSTRPVDRRALPPLPQAVASVLSAPSA